MAIAAQMNQAAHRLVQWQEDFVTRLNIPFDQLPVTKRLHWLHFPLLTAMPIIALYGLLTTPWQLKTFYLFFISYFAAGLGITAGYHRMWAHHAYDAHWITRVMFAIVGAAAVQGSVLWWCRDHRAHHRYTDTSKDPYATQSGFIGSHILWLLFKKDPQKVGRVDISDLKQDPVVIWQHKYYPIIVVLSSIVLPMLIAGLGWGDWRGGYFYGVALRMVLVHHATFCVNSLAHWLGESPFDDLRSSRDHFITALITFGEGYHNFHHEFPQDYRNAIKFYQYDPTKWLIKALSWVGLTHNLHVFPENEVKKGIALMQEKKLRELKASLQWGAEPSALPTVTAKELEQQVHDHGKQWVVYQGLVHDVSEFVDQHPGGAALLKAYIGKDVTKAFGGAVYSHSNAARHLLSMMRVGVLA
ncbi:stearoyl-CoA 9-desaturase [Dimargaris verticillata]|uniref:Acyl-CoA desaturase n=1 Tax=Dimargaris verticillata TaxID=2761393 RepID=A0A9W8B4D2_9FUNG|nr:stearoyl-CoA 9-desaturase [Dimargaris verticillata]